MAKQIKSKVNWNWDDIALFVEFSKSKNMSHVATKLGIDQTTVQRRLQRLEESIDKKLLNRNGKDIQITSYGENLLKQVDSLYTEMDNTKNWIENSETPVEIIKIAAPSEIIAHGLIPKFKALQLKGVKVCYEFINIDELLAGNFVSHLLDDVDFVIRIGTLPKFYNYAEKIDLSATAYYASKKYKKSKTFGVSDDFYLDHKFIIGTGPLEVESLTTTLNEKAKSNIILKLTTVEHIYKAICEGHGIGMLPQFIGDHDKNLVRLSDYFSWEGVEGWLLSKKKVYNSEVLSLVSDKLIEELSGNI